MAVDSTHINAIALTFSLPKTETAAADRPANVVHTQAIGSKVGAAVAQQAEPPPAQAVTPKTSSEGMSIFVSQINNFVQKVNRSIEFSLAEDSGRTVIRVFNADTAELIREIPSEEMQRLATILRQQAETEAKGVPPLILKVRV